MRGAFIAANTQTHFSMLSALREVRRRNVHVQSKVSNKASTVHNLHESSIEKTFLDDAALRQANEQGSGQRSRLLEWVLREGGNLLRHGHHGHILPSLSFSERRRLCLVADKDINIGHRLLQNRLERRDLHEEGRTQIHASLFQFQQCADAKPTDRGETVKNNPALWTTLVFFFPPLFLTSFELLLFCAASHTS